MAGVGHAMLPGLLVLLLARLSLEQGISIRKVTLRFSDCMPAFLRLTPTRQTSHVTRFHTSLSHELRDRSGMSSSVYAFSIDLWKPTPSCPEKFVDCHICACLEEAEVEDERLEKFFDIYIQPGRAESQASL